MVGFGLEDESCDKNLVVQMSFKDGEQKEVSKLWCSEKGCEVEDLKTRDESCGRICLVKGL